MRHRYPEEEVTYDDWWRTSDNWSDGAALSRPESPDKWSSINLRTNSWTRSDTSSAASDFPIRQRLEHIKIVIVGCVGHIVNRFATHQTHLETFEVDVATYRSGNKVYHLWQIYGSLSEEHLWKAKRVILLEGHDRHAIRRMAPGVEIVQICYGNSDDMVESMKMAIDDGSTSQAAMDLDVEGRWSTSHSAIA